MNASALRRHELPSLPPAENPVTLGEMVELLRDDALRLEARQDALELARRVPAAGGGRRQSVRRTAVYHAAWRLLRRLDREQGWRRLAEAMIEQDAAEAASGEVE